MSIVLAFAPPVCAAILALRAPDRPAPPGAQDELSELRTQLREVLARIEALEARHAEERSADRERIERLSAELAELRGRSADAAQVQAYAQMLEELRRQLPPPSTMQAPGLQLAPSASGSTNLLNPAITVFIDTGGSVSSRGRNKALNRFNLREAELDLRAAVAPFADGVLILAIEEEIESRRDGSVDIGRHFDIEEGYVDFHTLPADLALKVGKFRASFGRNNLLHTHDLPQVTRPLPIVAFLGPEGLATTGASLSWRVPNPWNKFLDVTGEIVNAEGGHESPLLGGPNAENPAALVHVKYFDDVGETGSFELGGTYLFAHTAADSGFDGHTFAADATYQWVHPDPSRFRSVVLQGEVFWSHNDLDRGPFRSFTNDSFGFYAFGQYQLHRDWYSGLRFDYTEFPNSESRGPNDWDAAIAPYLTWYITEFLRLRGEYQHRIQRVNGDNRSEEAVFLQLTFVFGSHPAHPYWVHR